MIYAALKVRGTKEADKIEIKMKMKSFHPGQASPWIHYLFVFSHFEPKAH